MEARGQLGRRARLAFLVATAFVVGCAAHLEPAPKSAPAAVAAPVSLEAIAERALPSVVLLVGTWPDGSVHYGAGLVVGAGGLVLTNLHVVGEAKSLGAMLYKEGRVSYTPMDGGLGRYLFEYQRDVVSAEIVSSDAATDLALVKIAADTSKLATLPIAKEMPKPGERVIALGHPQETVWSFTSGVVGALHHGAIQHDATLSNGSSGGPLLNERGEVVGINTAKVVSEPRGFGFARPIALAAGLLEGRDKSAAEVLARFGVSKSVDLSTPERAAVSCWRAEELGSSDLVDCVDWDAAWRAHEAAIDAIEQRGLAPIAARARSLDRERGGRDKWIDARKSSLLADARDERTELASMGAPLLLDVAETKALDDLKTIDASYLQRVEKANGLKVDLRDRASLHRVLKMGIRVDAVREVGNGLAWLLVVGRNPDSTEFKYAEVWEKKDGSWRRHVPPLAADVKALPKGFAPPVDGVDRAIGTLLASLSTGGGAEVDATTTTARPAAVRMVR